MSQTIEAIKLSNILVAGDALYEYKDFFKANEYTVAQDIGWEAVQKMIDSSDIEKIDICQYWMRPHIHLKDGRVLTCSDKDSHTGNFLWELKYKILNKRIIENPAPEVAKYNIRLIKEIRKGERFVPIPHDDPKGTHTWIAFLEDYEVYFIFETEGMVV